MSALSKIWKVLLAVILLLVAAYLYFMVHLPEVKAYESKEKNLNTSIEVLKNTIMENARYAHVQDAIPEAMAEIDAARMELYESFPVEMKEEDQIMYVLYLEELFGTEISFSFASAEMITGLSDGAVLAGLTLTVNYQSTYQGFKDMVDYLATDSRIASVQHATMQYDQQSDTAQGTVTLLLYIMQTDKMEYQPPNVYEPDTGKDNIFD